MECRDRGQAVHLVGAFVVSDAHDAREPLQLRCTDGASHLGLLTDLGHASPHVLQQLQGCHALLLEANHDPDMLAASGYPAFLKRRIAGVHGHLANHDAAGILAASGSNQTPPKTWKLYQSPDLAGWRDFDAWRYSIGQPNIFDS